MAARRSIHVRGVLACGLGAAALLAVLGGWQARTAGQPPAPPPPAPAPAGVRPDDAAAVQTAIDEFSAAFRKGDAKAVAARWTAEGEYTDDQGVTFRGRAALEKAYAEAFAANPAAGLDVDIDSVRFPSRDTAVVEGHFKVRRAKGESAVSRCSLLLVREDGVWRIAIAREWPGGGPALRDLDWLTGTWEAKRGDTVVTTTYEWIANKSFLRCRFAIAGGTLAEGGTQMIGRDPETDGLRVWTFEDAGGVGESDVTRDGKKWVFAARGVTADGRVLVATNILTPLDADSFVWHSVSRSLDDEPLPDLPPVKVVRTAKQP